MNDAQMAYDKVGSIMRATNTTQARNLPMITSESLTGSVKSISKLPMCSSSAKRRMVTAGITKGKINGSMEKKVRRFAWFMRKKVEKKNQPEISRKMQITI
jgi:hypothetical protein